MHPARPLLTLGLGLGALCLSALPALAADLTPTAQGPSVGVNSFTTGDQAYARTTTLGDGRSVVIWHTAAAPGDDSGFGMRARILNADLTPAGDEFLVNSTTQGHQQFGSVTALTGGGFVVSFNDTSSSTEGRQERARVFDSTGKPLGPDFKLTQKPINVGSAPALAALPDGGFAATWIRPGVDADGPHDVVLRTFAADSAPRTDELMVPPLTEKGQTQPDLAVLSTGQIVVTWTDGLPQDGDADTSVRARLFSADGRPAGGSFIINPAATGSQSRQRVLPLPGGGFVVSYMDFTGADGDGTGVLYRVFDKSGTPLGDPVSAATRTAGYQGFQEMSVLPDDGFVITWEDRNGDWDLFARRFDAAGKPVGEQFAVNEVTDKRQQFVSVGAGKAGLTFAWVDYSGLADKEGSGITARRFALPRETTPSPTAAPTPSSTPTPSQSPTASPSPSASPSVSPTATPTSAPNPSTEPSDPVPSTEPSAPTTPAPSASPAPGGPVDPQSPAPSAPPSQPGVKSSGGLASTGR